MFPRDTLNDTADGYVANLVVLGKECRGIPFCIPRSNIKNVSIGKLCMAISFAHWGAFWMCSKPVFVAFKKTVWVVSLLGKVGHVVSVSAKKQMAWINARTVIAFVANLKTGLYSTIKVFPNKSWGSEILPVYSNVAVSSAFRSDPIPTVLFQKPEAWKRYFIHKSLKWCFDPLWHKQENRRQSKVLSACSWPQLTNDGKMCLVSNIFNGYNKA